MKRRLVGAAVAASLVAVLAPTTPAASQEDGDAGSGGEVQPLIFVHGGLGSGAQFEVQAMRFASNGYPADMIEMFEHNSLAYPDSEEDVWSRLDDHIADMLATHDAEQVYLLAHSQGTRVSQGYLNSDPDRAATVARYVNLDGADGAVPDEVEALAIWGEAFGSDDREMPGAENVNFPDQAHTEVVGSPESFVEMHRFLTGEDPATEHVVRDSSGEVEIGGRVPLFPENVGAENAELAIWEVDGETGARLNDDPEYSVDLSGDAHWGPVTVSADAFYEFAVTRDSGTHHIHLQQFVRDNYWIRLLTSEPGGLADGFWETSDEHMNLVIFRNKEFWGDQGDGSDSLTINGQEILNDATSPRNDRVIGIFVHDDGVDGESDLTTPVQPSGIQFLTGVNLFIPAATPPDGTVGLVSEPRGGNGPESVCVPNWASADDRVSIQFNAFHHVVDEDGNEAPGSAAPECDPPAEQPDTPSAPPAPAVPDDPSLTG